MKSFYSFACVVTLFVSACFLRFSILQPGNATFQGSQRAAELQDLVRLQDRLENNRVFELNSSFCGELCREQVETYIRTDLNCTHVRVLAHLGMVEARCNASAPDTLSYDAAQKVKFPSSRLAHEYKNILIRVPTERPRPAGSMMKVPRDVQRRMKKQETEAVSSSLETASRLVHSVDWKTWHLDRIDQYGGYEHFDSKLDYACFEKQGAGSTVYVLDTGCLPSHVELAGRTELYSERYTTGIDDNGHGTHVAGLAAGKTVGVCKQCKVMCLKVMAADGSGSFSDVVDAMEHIMTIHDPEAGRGVVVMSLAGTGGSPMFTKAVKSLYAADLIPVVAAGNYNEDACMFTPANIKEAVTVGGSTAWDTMMDISNYGQVRTGRPLNASSLATIPSLMRLTFFNIMMMSSTVSQLTLFKDLRN